MTCMTLDRQPARAAGADGLDRRRAGEQPVGVRSRDAARAVVSRAEGSTAVRGAASPDRTPRRRRGVVLTRRGRTLVLLVLAVVALAVFSLGRVSSSAGTPGPSGLATVTVHAGDTLWQVAQRVAPQADPRVTVRRLIDLNHLGGPGLRAGQTLLVPAGH